ncbi:LINE-1 retrotransposable element ORF1 protein [Anabarilius grahami]|uniref:LINE-1 retrotransposable element ORF1 protein n=1 Tax=Anabarilius grahami TaxID=495550 RepID=A0A3N0ZB37_ANAGA|nr:LINE-1 retrotransposable element ORF1 protein [Anabarilius grahami]
MSSTLQGVATDVSSIKEVVTDLKNSVNAIQERLDEAEGHISNMEDVTSIVGDGERHDKCLEVMWNRIEDLENRSRCNNVRMIGLREGLEAGGMINQGEVLQAAREKGMTDWEGRRISFFPNMSRELARKQREFTASRRMLRSVNVKYTLAYPASLCFTSQGKSRVFTSSADQSSSSKNIAGQQNDGTKYFLQDRQSGAYGSGAVGGQVSRITVLSRNSFDSQGKAE